MIIYNGDRKIKFSNNILHIMHKYIQTDKMAFEAGGLLIGRENSGNKNLIVEFVTEPMAADKRGRLRYLRKDKRHLDFYHTIYKQNDGVYAYIGEWHTHPENIPGYSNIDANNWKKIGREMRGGIQYHVIVGIQQIGIWEYNANMKTIKNIDSIEWKRISTEE